MPQNLSPAGTQTSTAPSPRRRSAWLRALKALLIALALFYVGKALWDSIQDVRQGQLDLQVRPQWLIVSGLIVLAAYALLIQTWRHIVAVLDGKRVPFLMASKIWLVSNLGAYIPGKVWQIVQMGAMSRDVGISPVAAGTAAIINAAVNIAVGLAIGVITSARTFAKILEWSQWVGWVAVAAAAFGIILLPVLLPVVFRVARDRFGVETPAAAPARRVIQSAVLGNFVAWILYGAAFQSLALGVLAEAPRNLVAYTGSFATSYTMGYLSMIPGGIAVREGVLTVALAATTEMSTAQGQVIALTSRLWLLIIQVIPALIFLAYRRPPGNEKTAAAE